MCEHRVTDNPEGNFENLYNFCRTVDGWAKFAETSEGKNTDVYDYCSKICNEKCGAHFKRSDEMDRDEKLTEDGAFQDVICDCDCPNALLYFSAVQAAMLREDLKNAEPVKHGHWQLNGRELPSKNWDCSECGGLVTQAYYGDSCYYDYCPICGAKMDASGGEQNEPSETE